jgi:hypothetical protein
VSRGEEFGELRPLLFAIAYRILGSVARVLASIFPWLVRIGVTVQPHEVNGQPGAVFRDRDGKVLYILALDILGGQEPHRAAEETPVRAGDGPDVGRDRDDRAGGIGVGAEVVVAAQPPVIDPGDVRLAGVDPRRHPARLHRHRVTRSAVADYMPMSS